MGETTEIGWTDHTFNPWWGCTRVSPGCQNCYAEAFSHRLGKDLWGKGAPRQIGSEAVWAAPRRWDRKAAQEGRRARVFCASMADVFEDRDDLVEPRERLWELIGETPNLDWQLLTKRPENIEELAPLDWFVPWNWPDRVWIGTTAEDQTRADERVPVLNRTPAAIRFVSCEPLLGPVDLSRYLPNRLEWVIVGGESGHGHRPLDLDWARSIRDQCTAAGTPLFFKQIGGRTPKAGGDLLDGRRHQEFPTC